MTLHEEDHLISIIVEFQEGVLTDKSLGAALILNWVIITSGVIVHDNGPGPWGPTKPTLKIYSSQAAKSVTVVDKFVVTTFGPITKLDVN